VLKIKTMKYFDIHSHLQFSQFDSDREEVLARMKKDGVGSIVVGTDFQTSKSAIELSGKEENIFATVGLHPNDNKKEIFDIEKYRALATQPKVIAIGECGLDYFRAPDTTGEKERQKNIFEDHVELAISLDLPLMIHCRDAHEDVLELLSLKKKKYGEKLRGNIHFFAGDMETAKKYFDLGFTISFTGVITFTNDYNDVIKNSPIENILAETDSPYVAPVPYRGQRNEPVYVKEVVKKIASVRGESEDKIRESLLLNTKRVFGI